jgi:hypothetical protein
MKRPRPLTSVLLAATSRRLAREVSSNPSVSLDLDTQGTLLGWTENLPR